MPPQLRKEVKFAIQNNLMSVKSILYSLIFFVTAYIISISSSGCAQIGAISGGTKDTIAPVLVSSSPKLSATNISSNKITLTFDEYIAEMQDIQANVLVSPYPKVYPEINTKLKTVTVKLKDTLLPNTTYAINFGSAIKDVNEANPLKGFTYVFSTGNTIDSLSLSGKVILAETGKVDSTLLVMLYRDANDSSVQQKKPTYIANVKGDGSFTFNNLPPGNFNVYALNDGDGGKTYNSKTEIFAFADSIVTLTENTAPVSLFAYGEEKKEKTQTSTTVKPKNAAQKRLKYTNKAVSEKQDIRHNLELDFSNKLKKFDSTKIILTDTNYVPIANVLLSLDSNKIILKNKWLENTDYRLLIFKDAVTDDIDSTLAKTDTLKFKTKKETDYGNVVLRFSNVDFTKHPVLQFTQDDNVKEAYPITGKEWRNKLFTPGEYEIRILYDDNNNGKWDPGDYSKKLQPEKVITIPKKIAVKENWDNESEIIL